MDKVSIVTCDSVAEHVHHLGGNPPFLKSCPVHLSLLGRAVYGCLALSALSAGAERARDLLALKVLCQQVSCGWW